MAPYLVAMAVLGPLCSVVLLALANGVQGSVTLTLTQSRAQSDDAAVLTGPRMHAVEFRRHVFHPPDTYSKPRTTPQKTTTDLRSGIRSGYRTCAVGGSVGRLLGEHAVLIQRRRLHDEYVAEGVLHDASRHRSQQLPLARAQPTVAD